jgi:hypothetical protein
MHRWRRENGATASDRRKEQDMDGATVPVAVVPSRTEAELIAGLLRSNGLTAAVSADDAGGQDPQLQMQGVRVLVTPADEASARRLLTDVETAGPAAEDTMTIAVNQPHPCDHRKTDQGSHGRGPSHLRNPGH